jgi:alcohol dehydrogenase
MNALVYHGPQQRQWQQQPLPTLQATTDALVRMTTTTICGTDLHIMKGDVPTVTDGRILGHEGVGVVTSVGASVTNFKPGDRVLISCITSCGKCHFCKQGMYSHCLDGGWILGNKINGTQAEHVRIPHADNSLYTAPEGVNEEALVMLSDIFPTGFECGVLNGRVTPGDTVVIVGAGPIGLAALLTAQFYSPAQIIMVDRDDNRLRVAQTFGATHTINFDQENVIKTVHHLTNGAGADVAMDAVGVPSSFLTCQDIIAPGGRIANIGVHGEPATLHLEKLWDRNITLTTRLVDTVTTPMLLRMLSSGKLAAEKLVTHRFPISEMMHAYDTFSNAAKEQALKVLLKAAVAAN